jgi:hypothetical protein
MRTRSLIFAALVMTSFDVSGAALEFSAYLISSNGSQFLLMDLDTGAKSRWLAVGDSFLGHVITKFQPDGETLTLDQAGQSIVLPLKHSRTRDGSAEASTKAEINVIVSNEGSFFVAGKALNQLELLERFEALVRSGRQISLTVQAPPTSTVNNAESTRKVMNTFRAAGAKGSIVLLKTSPTR